MKWLHNDYETYVEDNSEAGEEFKVQFGSDNCNYSYCYYSISDVNQAVQAMATYSGQYSFEVFDRIVTEGNISWSNWSQSNKDYMKQVTENCIHRVGLYTRGFIEEIY